MIVIIMMMIIIIVIMITLEVVNFSDLVVVAVAFGF